MIKNRRRQLICGSVAAVSMTLMASLAHGQNVPLNVPLNTTDLASTAPTATNDLTFTNGNYLSYNSLFVSSNINTGTLDDLDITQALKITGTGGGSITLSTLGNSTPGAVAADLMYVTSGGNLTVNAPVVLGVAGGNFDVAGTETIGGVISSGTSAFGFAKTGLGTLTLNGSAVNTYTGATAVNSGTLNLDFSNIGGTANLISSSSPLQMSGGTLNIIGSSAVSSQTFASTAINAGGNVISVGQTNSFNPTLALGALAPTVGGAIMFNGPATANGATTSTTGQSGSNGSGTTSGLVAATGTITTTSGTTNTVLTSTAAGAGIQSDYATVGLYDFAAVSGGTIVGLSQIATATSALGTSNDGSYYLETGGTDVNNTEAATHFDDIAASFTTSANTTGIGGYRFNENAAITLTIHSGAVFTTGGILVTPNVGAFNTTIAGAGFQPGFRSSSNAGSIAIWQNDTLGYLVMASALANGKTAGGTIIQAGLGTVDYTVANSYTGATYLDGGYSLVNSSLTLGDSAFGAPATAAALNINGGTVVSGVTFTMDNAGANPRPLTLGASGGGLAAAAGTTLDIDGTIGGSGILTVGIPANVANGGVAGQLPGSGTGTANTAVMATGTVTLNSAGNFFTGGAVINGGATLNINSAYQLGGAVYGGLTFNGGTLQYANTLLNAVTDISANTAATPVPQKVTFAGNATIDTNGHAVTYANSVGNGGPGSLTVLSTNAGGSLTLNGNNTFTGGVTLTSGGLTLGGANVYTGPTAVNGGTLTLSSTAASLGNTAITVAGGATFADKPGVAGGNISVGTTGASITLNSGANFNLADGNIDTLTVNSVGSGSATVLALNGGSLSFDVGSTGADELIANNGKFSNGGTNSISVVALSSAPSTLTSIPLISVPNASGNLVASDFNLTTTAVSFGSTSYAASLSTNSGNTILYLNLVAASLSDYFAGGTSNSFSTASNYVTGPTSSTLATAAPGVANNVFLTANTGTANAANSANIGLNGNSTINSLTFTGTGTVSPVSLSAGSGGTLTLQAANAFVDSNTSNSYVAGTGLVVEAGAGADTVSANINLGGSQSFEIDNSATSPLTISGNIASPGGTYSLTKSGVGKLILSGSNAYTGGTAVVAGTLQLGTSDANALPSSATLTVSGGTLDLNGNAVVVSSLTDGGASNGVVTDSKGGASLTVNNATATTFSGSLTGGLSLTYGGTAAFTLSGSNSYTGMTTVNSGTVVGAASNQPFGSPTSATGGLTMNGSAVVDFTASTPTIASLSSSSSTTSIVLGNNVIVGGSSTTLTVNTASATPQSFSGVISDLSLGTPGAIGNLVTAGNGSLTLNNSNTYYGSTTINGTSTLVLGNSLAIENSTLNYNNPTGTLSFGSLSAATVGGLTGNQNLALASTSGVVALTIGNNNTSQTYSGGLTGAGSLLKAGSGTQTFSGASTYTGTTTVSAGTLNVNGSIGTLAAPTGAVTTQTGGTLAIAGGSIYATSLSLAHGGGEYSYVTLSANGVLNISGDANVNYGSSEGAATSQLNLLSGTASFNSLEEGRSGDTTITAIETSTPVNDDVYVDGATVNINTVLVVGAGSGTNSTAIYHQDLGTVTVGGTTTIANSNGGRYSVLDVNGGTFTSHDTTGAGIQIGGAFGTVDAELLIRGTAVVTANTITFGDATQTAGTNVLELISGSLYVGSGGIVESQAAIFPVTPTINLGAVTYATAPTLGAIAPWTTSLNMTLTNSSAGLAPIIQASNTTGTAYSIGLTGNLTGTGGLNIAGTGVVTLAPSTGSNNNYTGLTNVSSGTLVFANTAAFPAGTPISISTGGTVVDQVNTVLASATSVNVNGNMIIQGGASFATVNAEAKAAFINGFSASGTGILTSTLAAADTSHLHAIGVILNDNGTGTGTPLYSSSTKLFEGFDETDGGTNNPDTDILVKYTYFGDANLDGKVDGSDYSRIDSSYLSEKTSGVPVSGWFNGDFNYDGVVNGSDYTLIDNAFNQQGSQISAQLATNTAQIGGSAVPEPTTLSLLGIGAAGLLGRRRRK